MHRSMLPLALLACPAPVVAQVNWWFDSAGSDAIVPTNKLAQITTAMDIAVDTYNAYSVYDWSEYAPDDWGIRVIYRSSVATANASYKGRIAFGGKINDWTAMYEMGHVFGVGTFRQWNWARNRDSANKKWLGTSALTELASFDGPGASLNADSIHFWPYGLNTSDSDRKANFRLAAGHEPLQWQRDRSRW